MKNLLLNVLAAGAIMYGATSCNTQENLNTTSDTENVEVAPRVDALATDFNFTNESNERTASDVEYDAVEIDYNNIVITTTKDGVEVDDCNFDGEAKVIKNVPYGTVTFEANYAAVIPEGHEMVTGFRKNVIFSGCYFRNKVSSRHLFSRSQLRSRARAFPHGDPASAPPCSLR